jgi:hypothetical protein
MRILYAGDSEVGGAANYLLAILRHLGASTVHLPPSAELSAGRLTRTLDLCILSDMAAARVPAASQRRIAELVRGGRGLLMLGGWASFGRGGWRGTPVDAVLPVRCAGGDDRVHLPSGAAVLPRGSASWLRGLPFDRPPVICGLNRVRVAAEGRIVLVARELRLGSLASSGRAAAGADHPLLVVDRRPHRRAAALATDLAPHWCGGLVDWGARRVRLTVRGRLAVEVGDRYVELVARLVRRLAGPRRP